MTANGKSLCSCDDYCRVFGDCCVDAHIHCFGAVPEETDILLPKKGSPIVSSMECMGNVYLDDTDEDGSRKIAMKNYLMVASCPQDKGAGERCVDGHFNILHYTPVCLPQLQLIFMNIHCLLCHGFSPENAVAFNLSVSRCSQWPEELNTTYSYDNSTYVRTPWKKCVRLLSITKRCEATARRMQCPMIGQNCPAYSNPVIIDGHIYKNQLCIPALISNTRCYANHLNLYNNHATIVGLNISRLFRILLDFTSEYPQCRVTIAEIKNHSGNENNKAPIKPNDPSKTSTPSRISVTVLLSLVTWCMLIYKSICLYP